VAAADRHQALLGRFEREFHGRPYSNPETMLDSEELDAVYLYADNASGSELTELATSRGLHVLVEKPMSATLSGAEKMLAAAASANVRLLVNWPFAWWPQMQHALRMVEDGAVGKVWQVRYRAAHAGPRELGCSEFFCDWLYDPKRNGPGGAFMDYCCYGAVLARAILGMPTHVSALAERLVKEDIDVEDNGMLIMNYPHALAVSEGSWTQIGKLSAYTTLIYGTAGTLMMEPRVGGRLLLATAESPDGLEVTVPDLESENRSATAHLAHCVETGSDAFVLCDAAICRDTQAILEKGIEAARAGRTLPLD
jgi:predicted dehydrogenase